MSHARLKIGISEKDDGVFAPPIYEYEVDSFTLNVSLLNIPTLSCILTPMHHQTAKDIAIEIKDIFTLYGSHAEAILVNVANYFQIDNEANIETGEYAVVKRESYYMNYFNMSFFALGFEEYDDGTKVKLRLVEKNAYLMSTEHRPFVVSYPKHASAPERRFLLTEILDKMSKHRIIYQTGIDAILDDDLRSQGSINSATFRPYFVGYYKPVYLSTFMASVLECRRYGFALAYQPEFGVYLMRDLLFEHRFDSFDYFLTHKLMEDPFNATVSGIVEKALSFNISEINCFSRNLPTRPANQGYGKLYRKSLVSAINNNAPNPPNDGTFDSRYSLLPGMRYDVFEDSPNDSPSAVYRRALSDVQFKCMQNNTRTVRLVIEKEAERPILEESILSRLIGFIGQKSICMAVGLKNYSSLEWASNNILRNMSLKRIEADDPNNISATEGDVQANRTSNQKTGQNKYRTENTKNSGLIRKKAFWSASAPSSVYFGKEKGSSNARFFEELKESDFTSFMNNNYQSPYKKVSDILSGIEIEGASGGNNLGFTFDIKLTFSERVQFPTSKLEMDPY